MADHITIEKARGTWVVRAAGAVIGESSRALELREGDFPPVLYFPREDLAMALLDRTDLASHCPWKGDASYFTVVGKSGRLENAAWSYEAPLPAAAPIAGHIAFYTDRVTVEEV